MYVKAIGADGNTSLWEADGHVEHCGTHSLIAVPLGDYDYHGDERFPASDVLHHRVNPDDVVVDSPGGEHKHLVRWVSWTDPDGEAGLPAALHLLVATGPVYILNGQGDTVESMR